MARSIYCDHCILAPDVIDRPVECSLQIPHSKHVTAVWRM
jgi:hypothetical protein